MSRNFEDAYRAEVQQNIPDLWNRIESALPEKKSIQAEPANFNHKSAKAKKKNPYAWMKWASLAAAAMLVLLLMPAVIGVGIIGLVGGLGAKSESAADGAAMESVEMEAAMEDNAFMDMEMAQTPSMDGGGYAEDELKESIESDNMTQGSLSEEAEVGNVITEETVMSEDNPYVESYRKLLAGGMEVRIMGREFSSDNEDYCILWLELPEEAYETFEDREEFRGGQLEVRFYYEDGEVPENGDKYRVNVYEAGIDKYLRAEVTPFG